MGYTYNPQAKHLQSFATGFTSAAFGYPHPNKLLVK